MIKGIHGFNIAVKDFDAAVKRYEEVLGVKAKPIKPEEFAFPGLVGASLDVGGVIINIVGYTDENTSIAKFVASKGEGLFLVSLEVDNIEEDVKEMERKGVKFVMPIKDIPWGKVTFAHPKSMHGVQFEVIQFENK